jgi:hypothetical protein
VIIINVQVPATREETKTPASQAEVPSKSEADQMSTDDDLTVDPWMNTMIDKPYDQFLLFGDSITQQSGCQDRGFAFAPALQDGNGFEPNALIS